MKIATRETQDFNENSIELLGLYVFFYFFNSLPCIYFTEEFNHGFIVFFEISNCIFTYFNYVLLIDWLYTYFP